MPTFLTTLLRLSLAGSALALVLALALRLLGGRISRAAGYYLWLLVLLRLVLPVGISLPLPGAIRQDAPASQTAVELSKALGSRTVMSGSISRGKNDPSQSLQMIERPLMTPDELKSMPKGSFIVAKTGVHPMQVRLRLFLDWGIKFDKSYEVPERAQRPVAYASKQELEAAILRKHYAPAVEDGEIPQAEPPASGGEVQVVQADDSPKDGRRPRIRR